MEFPGSFQSTLVISLGGALGANARYWGGRAIQQLVPSSFPWGVLFINISGAFLFGLLYQFLQGRPTGSENMTLFLAVGFLGSYTTFSTLAFDTVQLTNNGLISSAVMNSAGSLILGVIAVLVGMFAGRYLLA